MHLLAQWAIARTVHRISQSHFWPTMGQDVTEFIKNCDSCQRAQRPLKHAELNPWPPCHKPNEQVHIDLFGPLQGDPTYKYVTVITCAFTNWTEVVPIKNKEAITVAKAVFEEWICSSWFRTVVKNLQTPSWMSCVASCPPTNMWSHLTTQWQMGKPNDSIGI